MIIFFKIKLKKLLLYFGIFKNKAFPKELVKQYENYKILYKKLSLINFKNIIDIGSNSGNWSILFKNIYKDANFFLIEPNKLHHNKIKLITRNYHLGLIGNKNSYTKFYITSSYNSVGSSIFKPPLSEKFKIKKIKINKLDNVLKLKFFKDRYDLIKIDTERAELNILKGASKTLKKTKYLILEIYSIDKNKINTYLRKKGFKIVKSLYSHMRQKKIVREDVLYKNNLLN
jgi:FkbM family methyltransferase|tara:strand:- start:232 stop:921 length:690 start_codon:yes stop_codon:yes gene_type:complete